MRQRTIGLRHCWRPMPTNRITRAQLRPICCTTIAQLPEKLGTAYLPSLIAAINPTTLRLSSRHPGHTIPRLRYRTHGIDKCSTARQEQPSLASPDGLSRGALDFQGQVGCTPGCPMSHKCCANVSEVYLPSRRALYQLNLVRIEEVRVVFTSDVSSQVLPEVGVRDLSALMAAHVQAQKHIPSHFRIVSCFG
jgi:hypothetical protein